jgi:UDP-N-acetylglucosamine 2-epimerase (non-hydrolysing)/UDP-GlcNAc3NAcA epimerase
MHGMSGVFFRELGLPEPNYHPAVGSGSRGHQTGEMPKKVEEVPEGRADVVLGPAILTRRLPGP